LGKFCLGRIIFNELTDVVLESATYNWPWDNRGVQICKLTYFIKCPCDLLIIIAKTTFTENCLQKNLKEIYNAVGCYLVLRTKVVSLARAPFKMCASMTWPF
jgi:Na+-translocating ferredoxin:NAD+ oxidoreductase RnfA subunit